MTTAQVLSAACKTKGWDATDLASQLTVNGERTSVVSTTGWLNGSYTPSLDKARALCALLGLTLDDLFPAAAVNASE